MTERHVALNPWRALPAIVPFVLPIDGAAIASFNTRASDPFQLRLEIIPEPYLGNPDAPVVLLNSNPGFSVADQAVHLAPHFNDAARANLEHRPSPYPFYLLDPGLPSPGQTWWLKKLRTLITATTLEDVANAVFVVELHGYHSTKFSSALRLPSQEYTRELVLRAIARRADFVIMRGERHWLQLVPELATANRSLVRNVQNPTISPGNLDPFDRVVEAVKLRRGRS